MGVWGPAITVNMVVDGIGCVVVGVGDEEGVPDDDSSQLAGTSSVGSQRRVHLQEERLDKLRFARKQDKCFLTRPIVI